MTTVRLVLASGAPGSGKTTFLRRLARQLSARGEVCAVILAAPDPFDRWAFESERIVVVAPERGESIGECQQRASRRFPGLLVELPLDLTWDLPVPAVTVAIVNAQQPLGGATPLEAAGADLVLVNKMDTLPEASSAGFLAAIERQYPSARIVPTVEAAYTLDELAAIPATVRFVPAHAGFHRHWITLDEPIERVAAELLIHDPPAGTLRVKGCLRIAGEAAPAYVQITDRSGSLRPCVDAAPPPLGLCWTLNAPGLTPARESELRYRLRASLRVEPV